MKKKTTEAMSRGLSQAVIGLRARMGWTQEDLATEVGKWASKARLELTPHRITIWRWESGEASPSPEYRMLLGRIAAKYGHHDLAEVFRAPISVWRVVAHVRQHENR